MQLRISKSLVEIGSLITHVRNSYQIPFLKGHLLQSRENDVYKLESEDSQFILKIYPTRSDIEAKLRWIKPHASRYYGANHVHQTIVGTDCLSLLYPEGERLAVLYDWIDGSCVVDYDTNFLTKYGAEIAKLHSLPEQHTENINAADVGTAIDVENPILEAFLSNETKYGLFSLAASINEFSKEKLSKLRIGFCHGDCHFENAVILNGNVRLIDFDSARFDYLYTDLFSILWAAHFKMGVRPYALEMTLEGYSSLQQLTPVAPDVIKYFMMRIELMYLISYVKRQAIIGERFVNDRLVLNRLSVLHQFKGDCSFAKFFTSR